MTVGTQLLTVQLRPSRQQNDFTHGTEYYERRKQNQAGHLVKCKTSYHRIQV
jgi:hypothetical protein